MKKSAAALSRVGVVDVGSNSIRLVVFDGMARSPAYFYNEKVLCGLGRGMADSGHLHPEGRSRALAAIHRFAALARGMGLTNLVGVATAAVREASDGPDFVEQIRRETGLDLRVINGIQEATLSAKGVLLGWPEAEGVVSDIGGSSMELAQLKNGEIGACETSELGPLKLADFHGDESGLKKHIRKQVKNIIEKVPLTENGRLFLVGGSWRALARIDMLRRDYPFKVLHEYTIAPSDMLDSIAWLASQDLASLSKSSRTSIDRLSLLPMASRVLEELIRQASPTSIAVSSYGLREGMLYDLMPVSMRKLDPLIEACRQMEATTARFPGFGQALYQWLLPIFGDLEDSRRRLLLAACLLHDTSWRAHPDYRGEVCFDSVTRANLGGVDHTGRLLLGYAITSRYKGSVRKSLEDPMLDQLAEADREQAILFGRALRLGAMLSGGNTRLLAESYLKISDKSLILTLTGDAAELDGEVVAKRLSSLASSLGFSAEIQRA